MNQKMRSDNNDCVLFMTAYNLNFPKKALHKSSFHIKRDYKLLMKKYHIEAFATKDMVLTSDGKTHFSCHFDPIRQETEITFRETSDSNGGLKFVNDANMSWVFSLINSSEMLLKNDILELSCFFQIESFLVRMDNRLFQVDSRAYAYGDTFFVVFELIDYKTGKNLKCDEILGVKNHFNLYEITNIRFFNNNYEISCSGKISDIILSNIIEFWGLYNPLSKHGYSYSYVHNFLVFTDKELDVQRYYMDFSGIEHCDTEKRNLSTSKNVEYYSFNMLGLILLHDYSLFSDIINDYLLLESFKTYILLQQTDNYALSKTVSELKEIKTNVQYLLQYPETIVLSSRVQENIKSMDVYQKWETALSFKEAYLQSKLESKKANNALLLNILLYILAFLSGIGSIETISTQFAIPFIPLFVGMIIIFTGFAIWWVLHEKTKK